MNISARDEWYSLFTDDINRIWSEECKELRKISMVYYVLKKQFNNFMNEFKEDIDTIRKKLNEKDKVNFKPRNIFTNTTDKENSYYIPETEPLKEQTDFFNTTKQFRTSPTLIKNRFITKKAEIKPKSLFPATKQSKLSLVKLDKCNSSIGDIIDSTIIDDTQEVEKKWKSKKRKKKDTTLTQLFLPSKQKKENISTQNDSQSANSLNIDDMLSYINNDRNLKDEDVTNIEFETALKPKKFPERLSPNYPYEEVVRGKERKKLKGWSCKECENFYKFMDLNEEELEKRLNECSKHRSKFQPRDETVDGFWDLTIASPTYTQSSQCSMVFELKK